MEPNNIFSIIFLSFFSLSIIVKLALDIINYRHMKSNLNKIPPELTGFVDEDKLGKINAYTSDKLFFGLFEYFFSNVLLIAILVLGIIPFLYKSLSGFTNNIYFLGLSFFGIYFLFNYIIEIPFSLFFNFKIEKKYGFNKMTAKIWIMDKLKELLITIILGVFLLTPLLFFLYNFKTVWWIFVWGFITVFSLFIQLIYPTVIAPLFNKFKPLSNENLKEKIVELLIKTGFKSNGVFEMDASKRSSHSNAFFGGLGKSKRIVLFDSLLEKHSEDEIIGVLAHELGHFKLKHILKSIIMSIATSLAGLFIASLLINNNLLYDAFKLGIKEEFVGLFLLSIVFGPVSFFLTPFSAYISRKNEYQADKFAKDITGNSENLILALKKLNIDNLSNINPAPLYWKFYYSHPPLFKRIQALTKE